MTDPIYDGTSDFTAGQDASRVPDLVPENGYFTGVNVNTKLGCLTPRWALKKLPINISNVEGIRFPDLTFRSFRLIFESGRYQAVIPYSKSEFDHATNPRIIMVVAGLIYLIDLVTFIGIEIPIIDGSHIDSSKDRINWSPADKFIVIFDYPARPVIIENLIARRADPAKFEVPISVMGTYNQNRLFISNAGQEFTGGDPVGDDLTPEAPITFEEVETLASPYFGQIFKLPNSYGDAPITAMTFLQNVDTNTGIGPLLIATSNSIASYQTQNPRTAWEAGAFGSTFIFNAGIAGPRAYCHVNSDIFFVSQDGQLRTASISRNEQTQWAKVPLSREVEDWLKTIDPRLTKFSVLSYFQNKIFIAANPYRMPTHELNGDISWDVAHGGMVVLSLDNIDAFAQGSAPSWDGLWTGVRPMDFVQAGNKQYVIAKDGNTNAVYELIPNATADRSGTDIRYIEAQIETKEYTFQSPYIDKILKAVELVIENASGDFKVKVEYKPSQTPKYLLWREFEYSIPWRICCIPEECEVNGLLGRSFMTLNLGSPEDTGDCDLGISSTEFRKLQLRITISGNSWVLRGIVIVAEIRPQSNYINVCDPISVQAICKECSEVWKIKDFTSCLPPVL